MSKQNSNAPLHKNVITPPCSPHPIQYEIDYICESFQSYPSIQNESQYQHLDNHLLQRQNSQMSFDIQYGGIPFSIQKDSNLFFHKSPPRLIKCDSGVLFNNDEQMSYDQPILTKQGSSFQNQIIIPVDSKNTEIKEINQFFSEQFPQSSQEILETPKLSEKTEDKKELKINKLIQKQSKDLDVQEPCYCSKTGCLKRYCRCFHSGRMCTKQCECDGCLNDDKLLFERNNAIKYVQKYCHRDKKIPKAELFSLKKSYGCYCKKSNCRKNYCECYIRGQPCTEYCECHNCDNCDKSMSIQSADLEMPIQNENRKRKQKGPSQSSQP